MSPHTVIVCGDTEEELKAPAWAKDYLPPENEALYLFWPRGLGKRGQWTHKSPPNTVERSLALLGQTVDTGRVRDIINVAQVCKDDTIGTPFGRLVGRGQAGILAAYAALYVPSVKEVVIIDPPASHRDGPTFLNVLRVLDIPEALGMLAPHVKLTLINGKDKAFDRTAQLYKIAGAEDKFERK